MPQDGDLKLVVMATGPKGSDAWHREFELSASNFTDAFLKASAMLGGDMAWESLRIRFAEARTP